PSLSAEKDDILRTIAKVAESVNELKRQSDDETTIAISSMTTGKRKKLAARYGAWEQVSWITFTDFPAFGNVHANKRYWNSGIARGTTDVVVFEPKAFREQDVIKLAIELKRQAQPNDENQAIGELFAANAVSSEKPIVLLTDLQQTYIFFWLGYSPCETTPVTSPQTPKLTVYGTKFDNIHQAATFARILLDPSQLRNASVNIQNCFPVFDKRAQTMDLRSYIIPEDGDIGNMDDFKDEMTA
ncbi:2456_t:CDS:2, partial [Paraglomus brasilianum]